jgi:hypothetical protein
MGVLWTPVRDYTGAIEQEEQEGEADGDNGTGEKCMKLEMERVNKEGPERVVTLMRLERGFRLGKLDDRR